jgi:hypothetical protein
VDHRQLASMEVPAPRLMAGARVDVLSALGSWSGGFEIVDVVFERGGLGYRLRRLSDGTILPVTFAGNRLVPASR